MAIRSLRAVVVDAAPDEALARDGDLGRLIGDAPSQAAAAARAVLAAAADPARAPFVTRGLRMLATMSTGLSRADLAAAAGAQSDAGTLLAALTNTAMLAAFRTDDPLLEARAQGAAAKQWLIEAEGGLRPGADLAAMLGISRQAVDKRRKAGALIALELGRRGYGYPAWQVHQGRSLPGLSRVISALPDDTPLMRMAFLLGPNSWLDERRPLDLLRSGEVEPVIAAAELAAASAG